MVLPLDNVAFVSWAVSTILFSFMMMCMYVRGRWSWAAQKVINE